MRYKTFEAMAPALPEWMAQHLATLGIERPSLVQSACVVPATQGRDVVGCAPTGQGKTLCYVLPILLSLARDPGAFRALILTPSRELALQVKETLLAVAGRAGAGTHHLSGTRVATITGGYPVTDQLKQLAAKPHVVVATPGRLAQLFRQGLREQQQQQQRKQQATVAETEEDSSAERSVVSLDDSHYPQLAAAVRAFKRCHFLVLDEADRLLATEFASDLAVILSALPPPSGPSAAVSVSNNSSSSATTVYGEPERRQTLLFSATMTKNMQKLAQVGLATSTIVYDGSNHSGAVRSGHDDSGGGGGDGTAGVGATEHSPTSSTLASAANFVVSSNILQQYIFLPQNVKDCYLVYLVRSFFGLRPSSKLDADKEPRGVRREDATALASKGAFVGASDGQILVFVRSCVLCEELAAMLQELGVPTCRLHSWMKQPERKQALDRFKSGLCRVMVATDVAHRGLDIQLCRLVIQYNLPQTTREYIHRVGRTGRTHTSLHVESILSDGQAGLGHHHQASTTGQAIALVDQFEVKMLLAIEADVGQKLQEFKTKENHVLAHLNDAITARELGRLRLDESGFYDTAERIRQRKLPDNQYQQLPRAKHEDDDDDEDEVSNARRRASGKRPAPAATKSSPSSAHKSATKKRKPS